MVVQKPCSRKSAGQPTRITRAHNGLPEGARPTFEATVGKPLEAGTIHWERTPFHA
jgi:hypothetical protein